MVGDNLISGFDPFRFGEPGRGALKSSWLLLFLTPNPIPSLESSSECVRGTDFFLSAALSCASSARPFRLLNELARLREGYSVSRLNGLAERVPAAPSSSSATRKFLSPQSGS